MYQSVPKLVKSNTSNIVALKVCYNVYNDIIRIQCCQSSNSLRLFFLGKETINDTSY